MAGSQAIHFNERNSKFDSHFYGIKDKDVAIWTIQYELFEAFEYDIGREDEPVLLEDCT
jgi:hypothetical protein